MSAFNLYINCYMQMLLKTLSCQCKNFKSILLLHPPRKFWIILIDNIQHPFEFILVHQSETIYIMKYRHWECLCSKLKEASSTVKLPWLNQMHTGPGADNMWRCKWTNVKELYFFCFLLSHSRLEHCLHWIEICLQHATAGELKSLFETTF